MTQTQSRGPLEASADTCPAVTDCRLAELLQLVAQGRIDALGQLYDLTHLLVFRMMLSLMHGNPAAAAELTREVFVAIWREAKRYNAASSSALTFVMTRAHATATVKPRELEDASNIRRGHAEAAQVSPPPSTAKGLR